VCISTLGASFSLSLACDYPRRGRQSAIHIVLNGGELYSLQEQCYRAADYAMCTSRQWWCERVLNPRACDKEKQRICVRGRGKESSTVRPGDASFGLPRRIALLFCHFLV
jgi:hypothetical protein